MQVTLATTGPAFSPDGRYLAFVRISEATRSALYVMPLPRGEPRLVTDYNSPGQSCWTADSREIVFTSGSATGETALWRISVDGGEPRRVPTRGEIVSSPTVSRNRLAYVKSTGNLDIWRLELTGKEAMKPPSKPLFSWSSNEQDQRISPDGSRIAFVSDSSGSCEIWVCNADGTKPMKLTDMKAGSTGSPNWSPDGKNIAFDSTKSGNSDIYVVSAEGGPVRRITTDATEDAVPRWSRDGRWIYFGSNRSGSWQIWKMPSDGGKAIQITKDGGMAARESADGYVYYCDYYELRGRVCGECRYRAARRRSYWTGRLVLMTWDLTDRGIYFIDDSSQACGDDMLLRFCDPAGKESGSCP